MSAVSVIIPALNEEASIGELLDVLAIQTSVPDEVIVVDAGSSDRTRVVAEARKDQFRRFQIVDCPGAYPGRARNHGALIATHKRLIFFDCGLTVEPNCIERLDDVSREHEVAYGWVIPKTDSFFAECAAIAYLQPVRRDGKPVDRPTVQVFSIDRELFKRTHGFPEELRSAEDLLFLERLQTASPTIGFASSAVARWELCPDLHSTFRRFRTYSQHNLKAGLACQWHRPLAVYYAGWAAITSAIVAVTSEWFLVPLILAVFVALRAARRLWCHRLDLGRRWWRRLLQLPVVMTILFVLDLATLAGTADYLMQLNGSRASSDFSTDEPRSTDA